MGPEVLERIETERHEQSCTRQRESTAHIGFPGWKVFKFTHDLCERPRPRPRPRMSARRMSARILQNKILRIRLGPADRCGSQRSANVRLTVVTSSPGASLEGEDDWVANLLKMLFLGGEEGASHSRTSCGAVAIERGS
jgi:hypothetical protein